MTLRRPLSGLLAVLALAGATTGAVGCSDRQSLNSNPDATDGERNDQRRPPPDASGDPAAPTTDPLSTSTQ